MEKCHFAVNLIINVLTLSTQVSMQTITFSKFHFFFIFELNTKIHSNEYKQA